jgi:hypothetical protein
VKKTRVFYFVCVVLVALIVVMARLYYKERVSNRALRLKNISLTTERRTPKPWNELLRGTPVQKSASSTPQTSATSTPPVVSEQTSEGRAPDYSSLSTQELAIRLSGQMKSVKEAAKEDLDQIAAVADEIITREPNTYQAYKAKLISLLVKEGKFKEPAEDAEVDQLLETMASFDTNRRENMLADIDLEENELNNTVTDLYSQIEENYMALQGMDPASPESIELEQQQQELSNQYKEALDRVNANILARDQVLYGNENINRDMVEIPFMRMMAKQDYDGVIENAQNFVDEFPDSTDGYYYLYRAYASQGATDQANDILRNTGLNTEGQKALSDRINGSRQDNPQNYWQNLRF